MKLPRRIKDLLLAKQAFIDAQRSTMEASVIKLQSKLFNNILSELIPELDIKDGLIQDTAKNYRLISVLDKTYKSFQVSSGSVIASQIITTTAKIAKLSNNYFEVVLSGDLPARFDKIIEGTNKLINLKIGLEGGKMTRGGFLQSFFDSNTIGTDLKQMTSKAVTSNMDMKEYVKLLQDKITGVDKTAGAMERQFQGYGYDLYQQYDRVYSNQLAKEFEFTYFVYQGGLIEDSRDFCVCHNNKVWSREEAETWRTWTPSQGVYPDGYEVKAKDIYAVPSYLTVAGYVPMDDFGGPRCRHSPGFLADELAFKMRPDLKKE